MEYVRNLTAKWVVIYMSGLAVNLSARHRLGAESLKESETALLSPQ